MPTDAPPSVEVIEGDITRIPADAIVNAANSGLAEGGGVCGAIFRAAGYEQLAEACRAIGSCATGAAVITPAFDIKTARYIVHAVGPVYSRYPEDEARRLLASTYRSAIDVAAANGCASIAFPAISTGIYGYPLSKAARVAAEACREGARTTGASRAARRLRPTDGICAAHGARSERGSLDDHLTSISTPGALIATPGCWLS